MLKVASSAGLGNVRPAGHMRPAEQLNVAREHILRLSIFIDFDKT